MARQYLYNRRTRGRNTATEEEEEEKRKPGTIDLQLLSTLKDDKLEEMSQGPLNRT